MTYDEFWNGDPWMCRAYREAHKIKTEIRNQELWVQGAYFYNAISASLSNAFSKKGAKKQKYLDKPFELFPEEKETSEAEKQRIRDKLVKDLNRWAESWNRAHGVKTNGNDQNIKNQCRDKRTADSQKD